MRNLSTSFVILTALCWGVSGGIGGILMADGWNAFVVSWYRGAIGLVFVLTWLVVRPQGSGLANRRVWFWSVVAGLGVAGNFAFYFVSIEEGSVAVAATLMYSAPVFVYFISFTLKLEKSTPFKWAAIAIVMLGILLLTQVYDIGASDVTIIGAGAGLLAGLSYAIFIFGFKYAAPHGSPQAILSIAFAVLVAILIWPSDCSEVVAVPASPDWVLFAVLGVIGAGLSFILYILGLKHTAPAVASVVAMVEPVTASLFGVLILSESLGGLQIVGMGLILVTVTALSVKSDTRMGQSPGS
ncbi:EamA/RhaT family transporter [Rhodohalobacter sp. SW132]|uniref:DMT family transporter n=1 Tax=Rhodohalobacter sp. SW132 TaxID=2293433 RepID=UPI000E2653E4|nr:EamA/RhaT family transporter [Rhodohalobacter sp. SW132]